MFRGLSEFGGPLAQLVETTPGALAAVLTDDDGDPIDYAHDDARISALDVQLHGAQLGVLVEKLEAYPPHRCERLVIEAAHTSLITEAVHSRLRLTFVADADFNLAIGMRNFALALALTRRLDEGQ